MENSLNSLIFYLIFFCSSAMNGSQVAVSTPAVLAIIHREMAQEKRLATKITEDMAEETKFFQTITDELSDTNDEPPSRARDLFQTRCHSKLTASMNRSLESQTAFAESQARSMTLNGLLVQTQAILAIDNAHRPAPPSATK